MGTNHRYTFADAMKQQRKQMQQEQEQINQEEKQIKEEGGNKTANASNAVMLSSGAFSVSQLAAVNEATREKEQLAAGRKREKEELAAEKKREKEEEARENASNAVMLYSEASNSTNHRYTFADAMKQQRKQMQQEQEQINQEEQQIKEEGGNKTANASNAVMLSS